MKQISAHATTKPPAPQPDPPHASISRRVIGQLNLVELNLNNSTFGIHDCANCPFRSLWCRNPNESEHRLCRCRTNHVINRSLFAPARAPPFLCAAKKIQAIRKLVENCWPRAELRSCRQSRVSLFLGMGGGVEILNPYFQITSWGTCICLVSRNAKPSSNRASDPI